jgi:cob(I)alamin adenosyltransferase
MIHIYTGEGKGKTTAAIGAALRAKSRGLHVLFAQFMKDDETGEIALLRKLNISSVVFNSVLSPLFHPEEDKEQIKHNVYNALIYLINLMSVNSYDLIVLDEFNCLISEYLISEDEAVYFIEQNFKNVELILTGRGASKRLVEIADYVTEMHNLKHPFNNGLQARNGIEY